MQTHVSRWIFRFVLVLKNINFFWEKPLTLPGRVCMMRSVYKRLLTFHLKVIHNKLQLLRNKSVLDFMKKPHSVFRDRSFTLKAIRLSLNDGPEWGVLFELLCWHTAARWLNWHINSIKQLHLPEVWSKSIQSHYSALEQRGRGLAVLTPSISASFLCLHPWWQQSFIRFDILLTLFDSIYESEALTGLSFVFWILKRSPLTFSV